MYRHYLQTAARKCSGQFNASSQNQVDQFFASLASQVLSSMLHSKTHNHSYNAGQTNTIARFNAELNNQRDQFNAQNQLVIAQANAQWRNRLLLPIPLLLIVLMN